MSRNERNAANAEHAGYRHARLEALIKDELISLLGDEIDDPALAGVSVAHVTLSIDYRHARVYFRVGEGGSNERVARALERAAGFFRARLADAVDLKRIPELRFVPYV
jgi:ribosome-binding factor A